MKKLYGVLSRDGDILALSHSEKDVKKYYNTINTGNEYIVEFSKKKTKELEDSSKYHSLYLVKCAGQYMTSDRYQFLQQEEDQVIQNMMDISDAIISYADMDIFSEKERKILLKTARILSEKWKDVRSSDILNSIDTRVIDEAMSLVDEYKEIIK